MVYAGVLPPVLRGLTEVRAVTEVPAAAPADGASDAVGRAGPPSAEVASTWRADRQLADRDGIQRGLGPGTVRHKPVDMRLTRSGAMTTFRSFARC